MNLEELETIKLRAEVLADKILGTTMNILTYEIVSGILELDIPALCNEIKSAWARIDELEEREQARGRTP